MTPRIIIMAAGDGTRWDNHLGVPKHLVPILDQGQLLRRTVSQFREYSDDVWVVIPHGDNRYRQKQCWNYSITPRMINGNALGIDKFWSSVGLWHGREWFIMVYGDVLFTDEAVEAICQPTPTWRLYARPLASERTGGRSGECFAFSIPLVDHDHFEDRLIWVAGQNALGLCPGAGGWNLYRAMTNRQLSDHSWDADTLTIIDDLTDDIDYAADYDLLMRAWQLGSGT